MKKVKYFFTFLTIIFMVFACEVSPEEIAPITDTILYSTEGDDGGDPEPEPPPN